MGAAWVKLRRSGIGQAPVFNGERWKVSTNSELAQKKPGWIDFDAGPLASGGDRERIDAEFAELVFAIASGKSAKNERNDQRDIGIFKSGVTL